MKALSVIDVMFRLAVCSTRKEMLAAIAATAKKEGGVNIATDRTMGMFRPTPGIFSSSISEIGYSNMFGTMFLNLADVTDEIIVHESAHATFAWEFQIRHYTGKFDDDDFPEQEEFCYFIGKAAEKVKKIIKQNFKTAGGRN